ncbi:hypothetical protein NDU88_003864 [Pleurodeles waltl]|uniref:Uncharacterized protein n=1 Tax=Pleurodeles waltl TaxID=8319 RepID=A0AAV7KYN0_PLEWA|nr:hypothetical protein NDU88_003864 [Pleurodeles waltl]
MGRAPGAALLPPAIKAADATAVHSADGIPMLQKDPLPHQNDETMCASIPALGHATRRRKHNTARTITLARCWDTYAGRYVQ